MKKYENKQAFISEIQKRYEKFDVEFENVPETLKDKPIPEVDKTPSEMLSYQLGWVNLLLHWEKEEQLGHPVVTPTAEYKWNNLGGLYQDFYQTYGSYSLAEQRSLLNETVTEVCSWLESIPDDILFQPAQRKWATTKAMWPVYKWVHINTVAPFTNFRTKIRKWKKLVLEV